MLTFTIKVTGDQLVKQRLQTLGKQLSDNTDLMQQIGRSLVSYYSGQVFSSQGGVFDNKWAPLSPAYARRKAKRYPSKGILEASGTMRRSFRYSAGNTFVEIDNTDMPIFAYHTSSDARTKMPRRQVIGINSDVTNIIQQLVDADIRRKLGSLS